VLGTLSVAHPADQGNPPISTPPAHSKQRTHSTREQIAQPGRCRAINVQLDEVNNRYSADRDRPPIVLGRAGFWSSLNASKPVMRQLAG
jgi:hypothetical protein